MKYTILDIQKADSNELNNLLESYKKEICDITAYLKTNEYLEPIAKKDSLEQRRKQLMKKLDENYINKAFARYLEQNGQKMISEPVIDNFPCFMTFELEMDKYIAQTNKRNELVSSNEILKYLSTKERSMLSEVLSKLEKTTNQLNELPTDFNYSVEELVKFTHNKGKLATLKKYVEMIDKELYVRTIREYDYSLSNTYVASELRYAINVCKSLLERTPVKKSDITANIINRTLQADLEYLLTISHRKLFNTDDNNTDKDYYIKYIKSFLEHYGKLYNLLC